VFNSKSCGLKFAEVICVWTKDGKKYAVTGTKGFKWIEKEIAESRGDVDVDMTYFDQLEDDACEAIKYFGSFEKFMEI